MLHQWCLKYWTAFSWASAAGLVVNVPRFLRFPVLAFFLREYKRYSPVFSLRIIRKVPLNFPVLPANSASLCSRSARFQSRIVTCRGTALLSGGPYLTRQGCMRSHTVTFLFQCLKGCARASR